MAPSSNPAAEGGFQVINRANNVSIAGALTAINVGRDSTTVNNPTTINNNYFQNDSCYDRLTSTSREEIVEWLKAPDFHPIYQTALDQHMHKTGNWFLETPEYLQLKDGTHGVTVWATGMPGSGKTILASISIRDLQDSFQDREDIVVAFMFLRYTEKTALRDLFAALLSQLVRAHDGVYSRIEPTFHRMKKKGTQFTENDLLRLLLDTAKLPSNLYIVADGLDEATESVKNGLLQAFSTLPATILIFSRPLDLYVDLLPDALHVSIQARTEDIELYVDEQVKRSARLQAILRGKPDLARQLSKRIKEKSQGMFLLARLQVESVLRSRSVNSLFKALENLPTGVDEMYHRTLERINAQSPEDVSIAHHLFAWLLHEESSHWYEPPLYIEVIQRALAVSFENLTYDEDDIIPVSLILSMCGGLVVVDTRLSSVGQFRFVHYTAQEYVKTTAFPGLSDPETLLAVTCTVYLEAQRDSFDQENNHGYQLQVGLAHQVRDLWRGDSLLLYAASKWGYHAENSRRRGGGTHPYISSFLLNHSAYPYLHRDIMGHYLELQMIPPLHLAAAHGMVEIILSKALPCEPLPELGGYTPFHFAARHGQTDALMALLQAYPDAALCRTQKDETILHIASEYKQTSLIQYLLQDAHGQQHRFTAVDINARTSKGQTALMIACQAGSEEAVRLLLSCEATQVDLRDEQGLSAFFYACCSTYRGPAVTAILLASRPNLDVDVSDSSGTTAFMTACRYGLEETVEWILSRTGTGSVPSRYVRETDKYGATAIMNLMKDNRGHFNRQIRSFHRIFELLLTHGSDLHGVDREGRNVYLWAAHGSKIFSRPLLLERLFNFDPSIDVNRRDGKGRTALMISCLADHGAAGFSAFLDFLLQHPRIEPNFVNARDEEGRTVLMFACRYAGAGEVRTLLSYPSIDVRLRDLRGRTALQWAALNITLPNPLGGRVALQLVLSHCEWEDAEIRKAVLACAGAFKACFNQALVFWPIASDQAMNSFKWNLEERDTVLLLVYALQQACRIYPGIFLSRLGILPAPNPDSVGLGYCARECGCHWAIGESIGMQVKSGRHGRNPYTY